MSYFICRWGGDRAVIDGFAQTLCDIAPNPIRSATFRLEGGPSQIAGFGGEKAIRDVAIHDEASGSWLALLGTPLAQMRSQREALSFLAAFVADPTRLLREQIDGNFAVFSYDAATKRLIVATDFNSTIPVFYSVLADRILFSSHELALARLVNAEIDPFGFSQALHLGATWGSHTRFVGVRKMLPCQICVVEKEGPGTIRTEHYWHPQEESILSGSLGDHLDKWLPLLREAVWKYHDCSGRKPVIADFTAGEDGRLLVAQCHALGIPFKAHVTGLDGDTDVVVATQAARVAGFELIVRRKHQVAREQLLANATGIGLRNDAYQDFFKSCTEYATDLASPLDDYGTVKYCGLPGGEAFRGSYYLRGKAFFPSRKGRLDQEFFTRMKYLLDFHPGLLKFPDDEFLRGVHSMVREALEEVGDFPIGTQIDHLLRAFQTSLLGLIYRNPLYLPYATKPMTRSIYWISPTYKRGGRLTKACTELLFPKLAHVRTQNGVPTIRRTISRMPLFLPEHISLIKKISSGAASRLFKWTKPNKWYYRDEWTALSVRTLLNEPPYSDWFSSAHGMASGHLYNPEVLNPILKEAKSGSSRYIPILGRIISGELTSRWVSRQ
jgi:hypothetical protein